MLGLGQAGRAGALLRLAKKSSVWYLFLSRYKKSMETAPAISGR
jgi:hypothetical protein